MNAIDVIRQTAATSQMVVDAYLGDLSDTDLMHRPGPGCNHIAWQLGHLIASNSDLLNSVREGAAPALPAGFVEAHSKEATGSDDASKFCTKQQYLDLASKLGDATNKVLNSMSEADLDAPAPEKFREWFPNVGSIMVLVATHSLMHAGQWVPVRRALDKPVIM